MSYLAAEDPTAICNAPIIELNVICVYKEIEEKKKRKRKKGREEEEVRRGRKEKDWVEKRFNRPLNKGRTHGIIKNDNNCSIKQTLETHVRGLKFSPGPPSDLYQRQRSISLLKKSKREDSGRKTDRSSE